MNLPIAFDKKMKKLLKEEYEAYIKCYDEPRWYGLRVNTSKISVKKFQEICPFEIWPIPWIENGFYYDGEKEQPSKHPFYYAGLYYLQEPSAMTPANCLEIKPGDNVLDVCAAPGGKATELGARLCGEGVLAANDISNSRAKGLLKNLELFGIGNMLVLSEEPEKIAPYFEGYFDKILIDAPCSGEGMFRKDKKMMKTWEEHGPEYFSVIQKKILLQCASMLKPGGMLLYSTCTFDPLENEGAIAYLLEQHKEFTICNIDHYEGFSKGNPEFIDSTNEELAKTVRIWPHKIQGEGHFMALLKKECSLSQKENIHISAKVTKNRLPEELTSFLAGIFKEFHINSIVIQGEKVYSMPKNLPDIKGIRFLRTGLYLGTIKKNRFEPSQALAMTLKIEEYPHSISFSQNDVRVMKYLKGDTLDVSDMILPKDKGWFLVAVEGFPLGWGKLQNQIIKNKYFPGWRYMS